MTGGEAARRYLEAAQGTLERIGTTQMAAIAEAGRWCSEAILREGLVHLFGSGHSRMAVEEMFPRYGSFPGFHPMVELSLTFHTQVVGSNGQRQAMFIENVEGLAETILGNFELDPDRDLMLIVSAGGTNVVPVEMALGAKRRGLRVIAITSVEHSRRTRSKGRAEQRLFEVADLVIDTCTPPGDAAVWIEGLEAPVGPLSSIGSLAIVNMIKVEVAQRLTEAGKPPAVLAGAAVVGEERSAALFEEAYRQYREQTRRL